MRLKRSEAQDYAYDRVMELIEQKEAALGELACGSEIEIDEVASGSTYIKIEGEDEPWRELAAEVEPRAPQRPAP